VTALWQRQHVPREAQVPLPKAPRRMESGADIIGLNELLDVCKQFPRKPTPAHGRCGYTGEDYVSGSSGAEPRDTRAR
jgi:hypothetical protein